jgi:hypothetical protein
MSAESVSLLLAVGAMLGLVVILVLPDDWIVRLARRTRRRGRRAQNRAEPRPLRERRLTCADCGSISPPGSPRWKAYLTLDREPVILCPDCADPQPRIRRLPRQDESD